MTWDSPREHQRGFLIAWLVQVEINQRASDTKINDQNKQQTKQTTVTND
jgi:hypothetical protein